MKLYYARNSRAVRVAWLLEELNVKYEIKKFDLGSKEMRSPDYLEIHPMGRVPTLEDGPVKIFESGAIIQYLLEKHENNSFVPSFEDQEFSNYLQWFHYAEGMIMPPMNIIVVETILLPPERRNEVNVKRATKLLNQMLIAVDAHMNNRDYLAGTFSAADLMTGHAVIMADRLGADISDKPNISTYITRLTERSAFQKASNL